MPAANLTELFDFEGQFERAATGILRAVMIDAYSMGHDEQLPQDMCAVRFDVGAATENKFAQLTKPDSWPADAVPPQEYFIYSATLEFRVKVPRDDPEPATAGVNSKLAEVRGKLRANMMKCVDPFRSSNLPYYKVDRIRPTGTETGPGDAHANSDVTVLRYEITFEIRKTAWPAWVEE